ACALPIWTSGGTPDRAHPVYLDVGHAEGLQFGAGLAGPLAVEYFHDASPDADAEFQGLDDVGPGALMAPGDVGDRVMLGGEVAVVAGGQRHGGVAEMAPDRIRDLVEVG